MVHQIVLGSAPVVGEGGEAALTVRPVTAGSHGQLLVTALADQGLHLADALLFASLVLEPDLREGKLQKNIFRKTRYRSKNLKYTDKKENKVFLVYKEIQMGAVAKSYKRKGFLMRRPLVIYDFATAPFWISLNMRKI